MKVYELQLKVYLVHNVPRADAMGMLANYIDSYLGKEEYFAVWHEKRELKGYVFDGLFPTVAGQQVYEGDKIYQFRLRTTNEELFAYLMAGIENHSTNHLKGLSKTVRVIPRRIISQVLSLTPVIYKDPEGKGYWRDYDSLEAFEQKLQDNLVHKYEAMTNEKIEIKEPLYYQLEILSKCAVGVPYKGMTMLGDKFSIQVAENETAQKLFYHALGNGMGCMCSRGCGFLYYQFLSERGNTKC